MASLLQGGAQDGWAGALDARLRVGAVILFAVVVVSLQRPAVLTLALALGAVSALGSGWDAARILRRLLAAELLLLVLLLTLPFSTPGEPLFHVGPLVASDAGLLLALAIALKASAVLLALLGLLGSLEPARFGHALAGLGVPERLVHLLLLTVRQIDLIGDEYGRLRQAMRARAFVPRSNRHTWNSVGWLTGMLLVRSLRRSRRLLEAMRCRGFTGRLHLLQTSGWRRVDTVAAAVLGLVLGALLMLDRTGAPGLFPGVAF
ncbi:MAG: cobalt ECF transporter T component CbiQ [Thiohalocapsa sp.]|nr:cobalt ECF transporter T component CbiQ [Thiohalocapsa sp.]MCF7989133.1 cobalt ECF transporter T component CbiQ [Thiohalocapsa sp.]